MKYDVVVIGAGIQGAGVAQAAAAAGYSVLVLEKSYPAAGTSSKSSKLIHGGLRYLESAQFGLVRESLLERALLLKLAPDLVTLEPLHIPVYKQSKRSALTVRAGLSLYGLLSGLDKHTRFSSLSRNSWEHLGGLRTDDLLAVFRYYEAQTDDAALTRAVLYSAMELGARCEIPAEFLRASIHADGCVVEYEQNGNLCSVDSSLIINCAGPWATSIAARIDPPSALPEVDLVQGSHLLLPPLLKHHFYVEAPQDKRAVFLLPWQGKLMLGTTEKIHTGAPESSHCSLQEQTYLLDVLQHYFPHLAVGEAQVESFAGLRVLPRSDASAFSRPREVMFAVDDELAPRVLSVMGGKLTTYRATAERVLNRLAPSLPLRKPKADTRKLRLIPVDWPF